MHVDAGAEFAHLLRQGHNLFSGALGGIRIGLKMQSLNLKASLGHQASRNGGINAARKQEQTAARGAQRKTARTRLLPCADKGVFFSDLNRYGDLGIADIDTNAAHVFKNHAADLCGNFGGG